MEAEKRCATCRYQEELVCHRFPPGHTPVLPTNYCWEWVAQPPLPRTGKVLTFHAPKLSRGVAEYGGEVA